ncbi:MAG: B12-binding domain-containing radical SAM protein [Desulfobulbus sp.]|jgi:anaerobic magnesium-protoporphyrin IX monomethyl ester cyclase
MNILLLSMPDITPVVIHESAVHMPNLGIASIAANLDPGHEIRLVDLVRKRRSLKKYLSRLVRDFKPDLIGLSSMTWQFDTCVKIAHLLKTLRPQATLVLGGYHATLMYEEVANSPDARWFDYMVRGEGEIIMQRLVRALEGNDTVERIPGLSYKRAGIFRHNARGENLDLADIKPPVRDKRRLTWGYHIVTKKVEVLETSRGCTRSCNFCCMRHMYGRSFRTYPIERVLADLDNIYYERKTRWVFLSDDNIVLNVKRVMQLCDGIIARNYKNLMLTVQADCLTIAANEEMVAKMAQAGFRIVFLGIENGSKKNLSQAGKGDIVAASKQAIANCHKHGIMVLAGLIFGFPDDDAAAIRENYEFFQEIGADVPYCQLLTPYPKTGMRQQLIEAGMVVNMDDYKRYNGLWANVRTRHLSMEELQFEFWLQREQVLGWWRPPQLLRQEGRFWTSLWRFVVKPVLKRSYERKLKEQGWQGLYQEAEAHWRGMNHFPDLEGY